MAVALENAWPQVDLEGTVVTRYGHSLSTRRIEVLEAAHPVSDAASERAARRILERVRNLAANDLVVALISGGGSALMEATAPGVTMDELQSINRTLLASGATIHEINAVRKHLSAVKGGRLAAAASPARVVTLAISDVPGDDPSIIASGPTIGDATSLDDVRAIAKRYGIALPAQLSETPKPDEIESDVRIVATASTSLAAAAARAREFGYEPVDLGVCEGESRDLGVEMARRASATNGGTVLISGGETVVTLGADGKHGRGGRNLEFLLALAIELDGARNVYAIAGDTDGRDGYVDAAGAFVTPDTLARARSLGLDARAMLNAHDSFTFFEALGDLLITGPTLTNVGSFRAVLVA